MYKSVVNSGAFINYFPCNHFINKKIYFSFSGEAKGSAILAFYFLLHKRAKPAPPSKETYYASKRDL